MQSTPTKQSKQSTTGNLSCLGHIKRSDDHTRPNPPAQYADIHFHGDASGSMCSMGEAPRKGAKVFVEKYREFG